MTFAVLANPQARTLRRDPGLVPSLQAILGPDVPILVPAGLEALDRTARELMDQAPTAVGLLGGDGTMSRAITALVRASEGDLPPVIPLGGGTMNTIARSVGAPGRPQALAQSMRRFIDASEGLHRVDRHLLIVDEDRMGFLFGNGLFARYIEAYEEGSPGPWRAGWVLAQATASALVGGAFAGRLTAPTPGRLEVDGELVREGRWLVTAAGTVDAVGLGFRPFFGAVDHPGALHAIGIGCSPFQLAFQLHRPWRARAMNHPQIVEKVGAELIVHGPPDQPYNLDGDLGRTGPVTRVRVGPRVRFLVPRPPRPARVLTASPS